MAKKANASWNFGCSGSGYCPRIKVASGPSEAVMAPQLRKLRVENYRAFARPDALELRPLTLLYGRNNSGKSTLLRLIGAVGDALLQDTHPFDMNRAVEGSTFLDLLHDRDQRWFPLELEWDDGFSVRWELQPDENTSGATVAMFHVVGVAEAQGARPASAYVAPLTAREPLAGARRVAGTTFAGLTPQVAADFDPLFAEARSRLLALRGRIQWITAVRSRGETLCQKPAVAPRVLHADGSNATEVMLVQSAVRDEVSAWFRSAAKRELALDEVFSPFFRWRLPPQARAGLGVSLADAGEGMTQALPILVAIAMRERDGDSGLKVIAMEEPTTHLHDDLQVELATHMCSVAASTSAPLMLLETHARPMLLGVQLALAKGDIQPEQVGVWWVSQDEQGRSTYRRVDFDARGIPQDDTLQHVFEDERRLLRELARRRAEAHG